MMCINTFPKYHEEIESLIPFNRMIDVDDNNIFIDKYKCKWPIPEECITTPEAIDLEMMSKIDEIDEIYHQSILAFRSNFTGENYV